MIFQKDPMFKGNDNDDQLIKIAQFMGTSDLMDYVRKYKLTIKSFISKKLQNWDRQPWETLFTKQNKHLINPEGLDLLNKMLVYDREKRIAPQEAMKHEYFKPVIEFKEKEEKKQQ